MNRLTRIAFIALLATGGCYSVQPVATPKPAPGTRVAISLNDAGRVALGGSMGPEIRQVDGNLLAAQDSDYVVSVTGVNYLNGIFQKWEGETVKIKTDMVSGLYEKKFSKGRTIAFIAAGVAVGLALRPGLIRSYIDEPPPPGPSSETNLRPRARSGGGLQIMLPLHR